jgi:hypothetical protein
MSKRRYRPKRINKKHIKILRECSPRDHYVFYDKNQIPSILQPLTAGVHPSLIGMVIAVSGYHPPSIQSPDRSATASGSIVHIRIFRGCAHDGSPHFNVDDAVYWTDCEENAWRATPEQAPDHYITITSSSGVAALRSAYYIPESSSGTISGYRRHGGSLFPEGLCPGVNYDREKQKRDKE